MDTLLNLMTGPCTFNQDFLDFLGMKLSCSTQQKVADILSINFINSEINMNEIGKPKIYFKIQVELLSENEQESLFISKTYKDFKQLNKKLKEDVLLNTSLPRLPTKKQDQLELKNDL